MRLKSVDGFIVKMDLSASDCALLAEVCTIALESDSITALEREADYAHLETMAAAFKAAAISAYMLSDMSPSDLEAREECLKEAGLR